MKIISIISQKGGSGKTTLAVNLSVIAEKEKRSVLLLDLDPQASSTSWGESRFQGTPVVVSIQAHDMKAFLQKGRENGADWVIVDTAPHSSHDALETAKMADLILIPCRAGILDIRALRSSLEICKLAKKEALVILNALPSSGSITRDAERAVRGMGCELIKGGMTQRIAYSHAMTAGLGVVEYEPRGKASQEIKNVFNGVKRRMRKSP